MGKYLYIACVLFGLVACDKKEANSNVVSNDNESQIIARVNQSPITQEEVEFTIVRIAGKSVLAQNAVVEKNVIESLISSRAMAVQAEKQMDAEEKRELELKTKAYREELLVKAYIEKNANPEPVTGEMVMDYYSSHADDFGGGTIKTFDYITSFGPLDDDVKRQLVAKLSTLHYSDDFALAAKELAASGFAVKYKKAEMQARLLDEPLKSVVEETKPGTAAPLNTLSDILLVRVSAKRDLPAKPLAEVSAAIRKSLAPLQLRKAISNLSDKAKQDAEIKRYSDNTNK